MLFRSFQGEFEPETLAWARHVHVSIFGSMPLDWVRRGTWIEAWNGSRRIAFAPHRAGSSLYFQRPEPVERYLEMGGRCRTGKVSIKIPPGSDFEAGLITMVVASELEVVLQPNRSPFFL
jgi:hypothetical protein